MIHKLSKILTQNSGIAAPSVGVTRRLRLGVEHLEDRSVPATFAVTTFADIVNPNDGVVSLREAIDRSNGTPGRDTVRLQPGV